MKPRWVLRASAAALLLLAALILPGASAAFETLDEYMVGTWRQEYGVFITTTTFTNEHEFVSVTTRKDSPDRLYVQGVWEIKNGNQLWTTWKRWVPENLPRPLPEGTTIEVIDHDHCKNKEGIIAVRLQ